MKKIFLLLVGLILIFSNNSIANESIGYISGNRISATTTTYLATTGTLVKRGQGQIWNLNFSATSSNGSFYVCDATSVGACSAQGGVIAEGSQSVSGNSYSLTYAAFPLNVSNGIEIVVTNGDLTITYN